MYPIRALQIKAGYQLQQKQCYNNNETQKAYKLMEIETTHYCMKKWVKTKIKKKIKDFLESKENAQ